MVEKQFNPKTMRQKAEEAADFLKILSHPARLAVLCNLALGERCVSELEATLGLSQSALSQHLAKMRKQGLVTTQREGKQIYYALEDPRAAKLLQVLYDIFCAPPSSEDTKL